jgi:hypothetical protein
MPSKFTKDVERCLELIKKETGINVRVDNDGDKYFIIDDKGHSFGHGEPYRRLYSSVYFCSEILNFMKVAKEDLK